MPFCSADTPEEDLPQIPTELSGTRNFHAVQKKRKTGSGTNSPLFSNSPKSSVKKLTLEDQFPSIDTGHDAMGAMNIPSPLLGNNASLAASIGKSKKMEAMLFQQQQQQSLQQFSAEELEKKEQRKNRFAQEQKEAMSKMKKKQIDPSIWQNSALNTPTDGASGTDSLDQWGGTAIIGTCAELEKPYLRLTSAPDPSTVRPLPILAQSLLLLKSKWKKEGNYTYICDQFKSLRQDLTVQRIKTDFTVQVYETHCRIAIEKVLSLITLPCRNINTLYLLQGDLGEFNQCSAQLKQLYTLHNLNGHQDEFTAYRILYMIHTLNKRDLVELISTLPAQPGSSTLHALQVRSALSSGSYLDFFRLYHQAPNMSGYLMDQFLERERFKTFLLLCKAYRPSLTIEFFATRLGFVPSFHFGALDQKGGDAKTKSKSKAGDESGFKVSKKELKDAFIWIRKSGVEVSKGDVDCKAATIVLNQLVSEINSKGVDIKGQIH